MSVLTLVKDRQLLYPFKAEDTKVLEAMKVPLTHISLDYYPVLLSLCKLKKVQVSIVLFEDLEVKMIDKIKARWKHELEVTPKAIFLSCPKSLKEEKLEKLLGALQVWYRNHFYTTEVVVKRSSKTVRVTLKKELRSCASNATP